MVLETNHIKFELSMNFKELNVMVLNSVLSVLKGGRGGNRWTRVTVVSTCKSEINDKDYSIYHL